jgi:beta-glucosidase
VALITSFPYAIVWSQEHVPAILTATHATQELGNALAEVLFGDYNPSGKLTTTWVQSLDQLPPMTDYNIRHGRTYMYLKSKPLYPFGHGLSYTRFAYDNLQLVPTELKASEAVTIHFDVETTGARAGDEVVQVYVHDVEARVPVPIRQLKQFQRLRLEPGDTQTVTLTLPAAELAFYDVGAKGWTVDPGQFEIMVGASSADIRLSGTLTVTP